MIQQYSQSRDDYGAIDAGTWSTYKAVWAEVTDIESSEIFTTDMMTYFNRKKFKVRTYDAPAVTTKMRISYDSKKFLIIAIDKTGRLHTTMTAVANDDE